MKALMLIISSDTEPVYAEHRKVWLSYMNSSAQIDAYFIQYRDGPQELDGNTFWLTGKESFQGIITKTIDSLDYFLQQTDYDFIIRTNMSSFWNFKALLNHLRTLPTEKLYSGVIGKHNATSFASGSGFIMSRDVARLLVGNRQIAENFKVMDDVDIGHTLGLFGIPITAAKRTNFYSKDMYLKHVYDPNAYHYRIKFHTNRNEESTAMNYLLDKPQ
jgi:hypothetical protein